MQFLQRMQMTCLSFCWLRHEFYISFVIPTEKVMDDERREEDELLQITRIDFSFFFHGNKANISFRKISKSEVAVGG